MRDDKPWMFN
jgi:hypothetical protein